MQYDDQEHDGANFATASVAKRRWNAPAIILSEIEDTEKTPRPTEFRMLGGTELGPS